VGFVYLVTPEYHYGYEDIYVCEKGMARVDIMYEVLTSLVE